MSAPLILPIYMYDSSSNGITLANSQIARPFLVPGWSRIRIGFRCEFTTGSSANFGSGYLTWGFCSGSNLYGDVTCGHFAGWQTYGDWTWFTGSATYLNHGYTISTTRTLKKIAGTETVFSNDIDSQATLIPAEQRANNRNNNYGMMFCDLIRPQGSAGSGSMASGSYTGSMWKTWAATNANTFNHPENEFLSLMQSVSPAAWYDVYWNNTYSTTHFLYINEMGDGYFDSVYVAWNHETPDPELKISHIAVAVFA